MEKTKIADLMEYLSLLDGRQVTPEKIAAWNEVIGFLDYPEAKTALIEATRDASIRFVEPKHVVAIALSNREKHKTEKQKQELRNKDEKWVGVPQPKCAHGIGLLTCDPCCRNAAIQAGLIR